MFLYQNQIHEPNKKIGYLVTFKLHLGNFQKIKWIAPRLYFITR